MFIKSYQSIIQRQRRQFNLLRFNSGYRGKSETSNSEGQNVFNQYLKFKDKSLLM